MSQPLQELYKEIIMDHYRRPRNAGEIPAPTHEAHGNNPLCGDEVTVQLLVEGDTVTDVRIQARGCSVSQASSSMMTQAMKGKSVEDAKQVLGLFKSMLGADSASPATGEDDSPGFIPDREPGSQLGDAEALQGVKEFPARIRCATLAWNTFDAALSGQSEPGES